MATMTQIRAACPREQWVQDKARASCHGCGKGFTFYRRRHHCRVCGDIVCAKCSRTVYLVNTTSNVGRACMDCARPHTLRMSLLALLEDNLSSVESRPTCPVFLSSLEAKPWYDVDAEGCWHSECAICLESFARSAEEVVELPCNHVFHKGCLMPWLAKHDECPLCRYNLPKDMSAFYRFISF
ncbi:hypothetical protein ACHHYP_12318 [Achlya hypogyna]|uniref:RING-type domain-containing protein n=1 Tax=Achlya hypogyna TaxID=1202772 RepID=A0A1V9ZGX3_ACHHY|nr:hypothetical protein ACHHYP_12318 [Achlya hypogyna]